MSNTNSGGFWNSLSNFGSGVVSNAGDFLTQAEHVAVYGLPSLLDLNYTPTASQQAQQYASGSPPVSLAGYDPSTINGAANGGQSNNHTTLLIAGGVALLAVVLIVK
ncbi:MAG: hypothetical protein PF501_14705 [Salinisphaera sp.]|jgi:hypothetical protein|nr:hypothetical protein [Salinisphaera sp.]